MDLSSLIRDHRDEILTTWHEAVRALPDTRDDARPVLGEHVSELLDRLAHTAQTCGADAQLPRAVAQLHASDLPCTSDRAMLEIGVLGDCVSRVAEAADRTSRALDQIAAVCASSLALEPMLRKLLAIALDAVPAIDTAAILVRDGDRLVTRATIGLDETFVQPIGEGFAGTIAADNRPRAAKAGDPVLDHPALRVGGLMVRTAYGMPLAEAGTVFGVAHVGSLTAPELAKKDRHLVATMFARAVPAIHQRLLRDADERASRELTMLRTVVDHTPQLAWIADPSGTPIWVNQQWRAHTGTTPNHVESALHPEHAPKLLAAIAANEAFHDSIPVRGADGSYRWYDTRAIKVAEGWLVTHTDVTEQRYLDEATQLLASSPGYHETLERIAHLVVPALADGCIVDLLSDGAIHRAAIAHMDPERLPAMQDWAHHHPALPDATRGAAVAIRTCEPDYELDVDGDVVTSVIATPLVARGRALGAITLASASRRYTRADVAVARELGRRVGLAVDNARLVFEEQQVGQLRDDLLSIVSHELRAPLSAIDMAATVMMQQHGGEPRARKQLDAIRDSAGRMDRLIANLIDMAAIQGARLHLERQPLDVAALVDEVLDIADVLAADKHVAVGRQIELPGVIIHGDRERLAQVLGNLVGHAIDNCRTGVIVRGFLAEDAVQISVVDDGPGMTRTDLARLFEPGRRTDGHRAGLGLYIAKGIVETHGGTLRAASTPGQGTTFVVSMPRRPV